MGRPTKSLPAHVNLFQAEAWIRYRLLTAVNAIQDWESLAGNRLWPQYEALPGTAGALHDALRAGRLTAYGTRKGGCFEPIAAIEWERMRPTPRSIKDYWPYEAVSLKSGEVRKLWPTSSGLKLFHWKSIEHWYAKILDAQPNIGKRRMAREIRALYEKEFGGTLPGESTVEKHFSDWRRQTPNHQPTT